MAETTGDKRINGGGSRGRAPRLFLTGDIHRTLGLGRLVERNWPEGYALCKDDALVILGDFGLTFFGDPEEGYWLDWLDSRPWTTLFIDGNHENFDRLYSYPVKERFGGPVGVLRPSVIHLRKRGHIYNIAGRSCWCFGGAYSVDKARRLPGRSWWPEEEASREEMEYGFETLKKAGWRVDYMLTHDCPQGVAEKLLQDRRDGSYIVESKTGRYLEKVAEEARPQKKWYFGHHHADLAIPPGEGGGIYYRGTYLDIVEE